MIQMFLYAEKIIGTSSIVMLTFHLLHVPLLKIINSCLRNFVFLSFHFNTFWKQMHIPNHLSHKTLSCAYTRVLLLVGPKKGRNRAT